MKTQITKALYRRPDNDYSDDADDLALCGSFIQSFFPNQPLPATVKVSASIRSWAFKGAKRIWIRHQRLGITSPSSWTWEKDGNSPSGFTAGGGMFGPAGEQVQALLGDKFSQLSEYWGDPELKRGIRVPIYVRVVNTSK